MIDIRVPIFFHLRLSSFNMLRVGHPAKQCCIYPHSSTSRRVLSNLDAEHRTIAQRPSTPAHQLHCNRRITNSTLPSANIHFRTSTLGVLDLPVFRRTIFSRVMRNAIFTRDKDHRRRAYFACRTCVVTCTAINVYPLFRAIVCFDCFANTGDAVGVESYRWTVECFCPFDGAAFFA